MTRSQTVIYIAALALAGVVWIGGRRMAAAERSSPVQPLKVPVAAAVGLGGDAALPPVRAASRQTAAVESSTDAAANAVVENDIVARVHRLRRELESRPRHWIPEIGILSMKAWIGVAHAADFGSEFTLLEAFGSLRNAAKSEFGDRIMDAMTRLKLAGGGRPAEIGELAAHLPSPAEVEMLNRYMIDRTGSGAFRIREKSSLLPNEPRFEMALVQEADGIEGWEQVHRVETTSSMQRLSRVDAPPPALTEEEAFTRSMAERFNGAMVETVRLFEPDRTRRNVGRFAEANNGAAPATLSDLKAYFSPEEARKLADNFATDLATMDFVEAQGRLPRNAADLQPYLAKRSDPDAVLRAVRIALRPGGNGIDFYSGDELLFGFAVGESSQ